MPGVERLSLDLLLSLAEEASRLAIPVLAVFPVIEAGKKDLNGSESFNANGLVPRTVSALKKEFPNLGVMTDVALDPYTSHGQDGLIDDQGRLLNDETVEVLVKQALVQSQAGCRYCCPVRHDGRPNRGYPQGLGNQWANSHPHHGLCGEVRLKLLRPLSGRGGLRRKPWQGR